MIDLVTGGSGYLGHVLVERLLRAGRRVRVFDLRDAGDRPPDVELQRGDVRDPDAVRRACDGVAVVYHNVAQVPLAKDRALFWSVNRDGTENVLRAARDARVQKVVHTSSSAVFGVPKTNPVRPDTEPCPMEEYGRAKLAGERLCEAHASRGLDVSIVRPRTILGHGRLGIFQILFEWVRTGYNVPVLGKGDNVYQFVHADDFANACILAAGRHGFAVYNCGTDRFGTMREALEDLCRHAGTGSRVRSVPVMPAVVGMKIAEWLGLSPLGAYHSLMYGRSMYFDISKAERELGWHPRYSNSEMFIESYDAYLKDRDAVLGSNSGSPHRSAVHQGILGLVKRLL